MTLRLSFSLLQLVFVLSSSKSLFSTVAADYLPPSLCVSAHPIVAARLALIFSVPKGRYVSSPSSEVAEADEEATAAAAAFAWTADDARDLFFFYNYFFLFLLLLRLLLKSLRAWGVVVAAHGKGRNEEPFGIVFTATAVLF